MIKTAAPTATQAFVCDIHTLPAMYRSRRYSFGLNIAMTSFGNGTKNPNCNYRYFEFYALSHMYHGRGYYQTPNAPKRELRPGEGILIAPGFVHYYGGSNSEPYYEDTICFFGSSADYLFEQGLLRSGILPLGETRHLQPIIKLAQSASVDDYLSACVRLQELLLQFHRRNSENPSNDRPETERLQELLDIPANRKVIEFSQISRDGEGQPVAYDVKFVPYARAYPSVESEIRYAVLPDLTFAKLSSFSVYSQITVTAVAAEGEPARALECPEGTPLLLIEQIFLQQDGSRVGVQHHYSRAPRGKLTGTSGHRQ